MSDGGRVVATRQPHKLHMRVQLPPPELAGATDFTLRARQMADNPLNVGSSTALGGLARVAGRLMMGMTANGGCLRGMAYDRGMQSLEASAWMVTDYRPFPAVPGASVTSRDLDAVSPPMPVAVGGLGNRQAGTTAKMVTAAT